MINRLRAISTFLMLLLGTAGVGFGIFNQTDPTAPPSMLVVIISTAGSALFGASLTMFIDRVLGTELMAIKSYLFKSEKFESVPEYLDRLKGRWHHYDISEKSNEVFWQYLVLDFERDTVSNTLRATFANEGHDGTLQKYDATAGYRNGSMVIFMRARDSSEQDSIVTVPGVMSTNLKAHLGIQFLETWDGNKAFTYSIISRRKLVANDKLTLDDQEALFRELRQLVKIHKYNPIVSDVRLKIEDGNENTV